MSAATCGAACEIDPDVAALIRATLATRHRPQSFGDSALNSTRISVTAWCPHERSDMRGRMRGRPGCRFAHPGYACGSPPPLHPQTLREIAAVHMLPEMIELAFKVDPHLAADIAPEPAEGVLLREIAPG